MRTTAGDKADMQAHPDAQLSQAQLDELAYRLISMRRDLTSSIESLTEQATEKNDCQVRDTADAASLQENRARASRISIHHEETILAIDSALDRIKEGRYGVSEKSGEPIAYERLLLIPWARNSVGE